MSSGIIPADRVETATSTDASVEEGAAVMVDIKKEVVLILMYIYFNGPLNSSYSYINGSEIIEYIRLTSYQTAPVVLTSLS